MVIFHVELPHNQFLPLIMESSDPPELRKVALWRRGMILIASTFSQIKNDEC